MNLSDHILTESELAVLSKLWFFLLSWEIARLQSTCAIHFRVKPKRKRICKCRGGRPKVRKIKVLTILIHQNRYSVQIGYNPGNLIEINIINNLSSKSTCKESFRIGLFNARSVGTVACKRIYGIVRWCQIGTFNFIIRRSQPRFC